MTTFYRVSVSYMDFDFDNAGIAMNFAKLAHDHLVDPHKRVDIEIIDIEDEPEVKESEVDGYAE